jgi:3-hydroxyacyl-[acyl-carrier-protein] dehydratase
MLKDIFFRIITIDKQSAAINAVLELNPDHKIFKGHFPGTPVVPGVCMMQIVKEMIEMSTGTSMLLSKADSMKFLMVVDPRVNKVVKIDILYKTIDKIIDVTASLSAENTVCFKFKGRFVIA